MDTWCALEEELRILEEAGDEACESACYMGVKGVFPPVLDGEFHSLE